MLILQVLPLTFPLSRFSLSHFGTWDVLFPAWWPRFSGESVAHQTEVHIDTWSGPPEEPQPKRLEVGTGARALPIVAGKQGWEKAQLEAVRGLDGGCTGPGWRLGLGRSR